MGYSHGEWIPMPSYEQLADSVFELVVAGRRNDQGGIDIAMVEAGATEQAMRLIEGGQAATDEAAVARGLEEAKPHIATLIEAQLDLRKQIGAIPVVEFPVVEPYTAALYGRAEGVAASKLAAVVKIAGKQERNAAEEAALVATLAQLGFTEEHEDFGLPRRRSVRSPRGQCAIG